MNRRSFLSLFAAAPVALPVAIKTAAAADIAPGRLYMVTDEYVTGASQVSAMHYDSGYLEALNDMRGRVPLPEWQFAEGDPADVQAQMREHDLFDFDETPSPFRVSGNPNNSRSVA